MSEETAENSFDVVVIGGGPAGLTAGMYAARTGLATAVIAGELGGQMAWAHRIDNFIGWEPVSGKELLEHFREHTARFGVRCFEGQLVNAIIPSDGSFEILTREGTMLKTRAVIIATGKAPSRLQIPGENELVGRGVSYCATCDAAFFTGKPVTVVGPGEAAADAALQLSALGAGPVTLVSEREPRVPEVIARKLAEDPAITVRGGTKPLRIEGSDRVEALVVGTSAGEDRIEAAGVFIEIGTISADEFALGLVDVNERGEIIVDKAGATSTAGIYAAGDVTDEFGKQIITAAGQGARAAMAAGRDLKRRE